MNVGGALDRISPSEGSAHAVEAKLPTTTAGSGRLVAEFSQNFAFPLGKTRLVVGARFRVKAHGPNEGPTSILRVALNPSDRVALVSNTSTNVYIEAIDPADGYPKYVFADAPLDTWHAFSAELTRAVSGTSASVVVKVDGVQKGTLTARAVDTTTKVLFVGAESDPGRGPRTIDIDDVYVRIE